MNRQIKEIVSKSILTPTKGALDGYSHSLNPYAGCVFACTYCYVRQLPVGLFRDEEWGTWVDIKSNATQLLHKELVKAKKKGPVTIFLSSATDPYQPIEHQTQLTRSIVEGMLDERPDFVHIQTRSPLVVRDIDLFKKFGDSLRVSITIETDLDEVRKAFSPAAPPIQARLAALKKIKEAGITTQATLAPLLPCSHAFPSKIKQIADRVTIDDYWMGDGSGGRRTHKLGIYDIYKKLGLEKWYHPEAYQKVYKLMKEELEQADILISKDGFNPK